MHIQTYIPTNCKHSRQGSLIMIELQKLHKISAIINPTNVSQRWIQGQQDPSDVQWSKIRSKKRIQQQALNALQRQVEQGEGISKYFKGLNKYIEHKIRGFAKQDIQGTQYDISKYKAPQKKGDVIIAFSGARNQPGGNMDDVMAERYGHSNYVIFRPSQVDQALQYVKTLPKGSRIYVQGMSHGGAAAAQFASRGPRIERLITYDPVSHFGRLRQKPRNVKKWYNVVAGDYDGQAPTNPLKGFGQLFSAFRDAAIDHGGRWGQVKGAINVHAPQASHSDVRQMYRVLNAKFLKDRIMRKKLLESLRKV